MKTVEALMPEAAVTLDPSRRSLELGRHQAAVPRPPFLALLDEAGVLEHGQGFTIAGSVTSNGRPLGDPVTIGGTSEQTAGYSILEAASRQALEQLLREHPHLHMPGGTITIHEFVSVPGM